MDKNILLDKIIYFKQTGDGYDEIIKTFNPLLKKYASKINNYNFYYDYCNFLLITLYYLDFSKLKVLNDGVIIRYLQIALKNYYIKNLKQNSETSYSISIDSVIEESVPSSFSYNTIDLDIELEMLITHLNKRQQDIIKLIFFYGYSVEEIAKILNISRQAVNQCKNRALCALRDMI